MFEAEITGSVWKDIESVLEKHWISYTMIPRARKEGNTVVSHDMHISINLVIPNYSEFDFRRGL